MPAGMLNGLMLACFIVACVWGIVELGYLLLQAYVGLGEYVKNPKKPMLWKVLCVILLILMTLPVIIVIICAVILAIAGIKDLKRLFDKL